MNLVDRAKNIITSPKTEWDVVANEEPNIQQIITGYVIPLALISAIASFVGYGLVGAPFLGASVTWGIVQAIIVIFTAVLVVIIAAFVIDALAPSFGSQKNLGRALQLIAYSMTPIWVGGILNIIPAIGWLGSLFGLYGLYLLYIGLSPVMKTPEEKKLGYVIVSIVVLLVVYFVIAAILTAILFSVFGLSMWGASNFYR
ncbi:MAG: YIP1 family protein [Bacteroidetes bacterium]|nr:YIP1 family protein [Bacteroidota bacterium]